MAGFHRKRSEFHDTVHCPNCGTQLPDDTDECDWDKEYEKIVCHECGFTFPPEDVRIIKAEDHYYTWGDEEYHRLKDEGLL